MDHREVAEVIATRRGALPSNRALIVGISGIDASGKGFVTAQLADQLRNESLEVETIGADGWLNLPAVRFNDANPGLHFYDNAFRLDQMFTEVILPLRHGRSVKCEVDHLVETASSFTRHTYQFNGIDVLLVEGIFLFKPEYRENFDLRVWIDCSFETALQRAIARSQEGLSPEETIIAYEKIYFPAQRIHFEKDHPAQVADIVLLNDNRVAVAGRR